jgi:DNA-binding NarL/FixJ family response regulator
MRPAACARDATGVSLRCLIVDDNAYFLEAAADLLTRQGLTVVGVASDTAGALRLASELRPDVVLVDIMLGHESGIDLARRLAGANSGGPVIILISTHAEADFADLIQEAPVAGFVPKSELSASAIRQLAGA